MFFYFARFYTCNSKREKERKQEQRKLRTSLKEMWMTARFYCITLFFIYENRNFGLHVRDEQRRNK